MRVKFKPNGAQIILLKDPHNRKIIPKARQLGMCLDPNTPVLKADLTYVPISELNIGDEVVAVDEYPIEQENRRALARRMRTATVQGVVKVYHKAFKITMDDGRTVICTEKHPWLIKAPTGAGLQWRSLAGNPETKRSKLKVGMKIRCINDGTWDEPDYEDGWFSGMIDGEGSFNLSKNDICIAQVMGAVWDRMIRYVEREGYSYRIEHDKNDRPSCLGSKPVGKVCIGRTNELFKLMGKTRPSRFEGVRFWENKEFPGKKTGVCYSVITKIEELPEQELIDLQTSTGTYIANGLVSHNTTFIQLYMLDTCLFRPDTNAGVIAHTLTDVQKFFKDKIKYAYDNLADHLKQQKQATSDSANELRFENGSVISVGTSLRGGTNQLLHISEYGKVCAKYPDKAKEIKTGAFPSVPKDGQIWIESTTEGRGGDFHKKCMDAKQLQESNTPLTPLDYKLIFLPWFTDPEYTLEQNVVINTEQQEYFEDLERKGVKLTVGQKNWYVVTLREQDEDMTQEYPSTLEEAFMGSQKGAIFGKQMKMLRNNKRILKVPIQPALPVHTAWDIGRDTTSIWFFQKVGLHYHFVDYYENEGEDAEFYINVLKGRNYLGSPYRYGTAFLPHDGERKYFTQKLSACDILENYGFETRQVPRTKDKWLSIGRARKALPLCLFDEEKCDEGLIHLENYSKEWDEKHAVFKKVPIHNAASHCADAIMSFADGFFLYDEVEDEEYERYNDPGMGRNATTGY